MLTFKRERLRSSARYSGVMCTPFAVVEFMAIKGKVLKKSEFPGEEDDNIKSVDRVKE